METPNQKLRVSKYRNWHQPSSWFRSTSRELHNLWKPTASRSNQGVELKFTNDEGKQITFDLSEADATELKNKIEEKLNS